MEVGSPNSDDTPKYMTCNVYVIKGNGTMTFGSESQDVKPGRK